MNGSRSAARRGSSFGSGPRRGTDPEGGERSAWKGLCGPSGLNLDHARIPHIQKMVYDVLVPLVVASEEALPLSQFTQKCCDVLLPVLEREQELSTHAFKSQWGRLNEFVCPELARQAGLGDSGFNRETKTVRLDLKVAASSPAGHQHQQHSRASSTTPVQTGMAATSAAPAAPAPAAAPPMAASMYWTTVGVPAGAGPAAARPGMPLPIALPHGAVGGPGAAAVAPVPVVPPALCAYCQGPHSMKHCRDFHQMLQSIYQAGYQRGMEAARQAQQAALEGGSNPDKPAQ